jgi:hypothetical protein
MTHTADIPLASGLRRIVDDALVVVGLGVRRFWRGGAHANAPAGEASSLLNRLVRLLRFAFVILAVHLYIKPARKRGRAARTTARITLRRPAFPLFPPYRIRFDDGAKGVAPPAFAHPRARVLIAQRKLDALTRALADPMPLIRRMARRLPTQLMVFGWRPPRRPPPLHKRDYCEELKTTFVEA